MNSENISLPFLGWREWLALPDLNINKIKAKIDTGARTSALHAFFIDPYHKGSTPWIMFGIHPNQHDIDRVVECHAPVKDIRVVSDSGGHKSKRYVIDTQIVLGETAFSAEMTLTNRDNMKFRMLLGRTAMKNNFLVDPQASYLQAKPDQALYRKRGIIE